MMSRFRNLAGVVGALLLGTILVGAEKTSPAQRTVSEVISASRESQGLILAASVVEDTVRSGDPVIEISISVSATEHSFAFLYAQHIPQVFGVYVLGPWGWVHPEVVLPENWMHQEVMHGEMVKVMKGKPFNVRVRLGDFFNLEELRKRPGQYQINVKWFVAGQGLEHPIDSGPISIPIASI